MISQNYPIIATSTPALNAMNHIQCGMEHQMKRYLHSLTHVERCERSDRHLAFYLTFIAGAANAGGFMAVGQYTSHMSGIVASMADRLVMDDMEIFLTGATALFSFIFGAAVSSILINWGRRRNAHSVYALPLAVEAAALSLFAFSGLYIHDALAINLIIALLAMIMGLQNAMITKLSGARIRTTHITGLVTDTGIELGKMAYFNRNQNAPAVRADMYKLWLLSSMIALFFVGGVSGALLFKNMGTQAALLLVVPLALMALFPLLEDLKQRQKAQLPPK